MSDWLPVVRIRARAACACGILVIVGCYQEAPGPSTQDTTQRLHALLSDPDAVMRRTAAESLGKIGDREAIPRLVERLGDDDPHVRATAARSLGVLASLDYAAVVGLLRSMRDPDDSVRHAAAQALGNGAALPALAPALREMAAHADPAVRRDAAQTMFLTGGQEFFDTLTTLTADADPAVRQIAVAALGDSADRRAIPTLRDRLRRDTAPEVRAESAYRLQWVGDESVLADLDSVAMHDRSSAVQRWARQSANEIREEMARGSDSAHRPDRPAARAPAHRSP